MVKQEGVLVTESGVTDWLFDWMLDWIIGGLIDYVSKWVNQLRENKWVSDTE